MKTNKTVVQKHEQMVYPTVRVRAGAHGGSGSVVYSKKYKGEVYTYIVTNHHVIASCIHVEKKWNPVLKKKVDTEVIDTVRVEYFKYNNHSNCVGSFGVDADIVAYSEYEGGEDWALLRVRDKETVYDYVVNMFPKENLEDIHIFDEVYAVGASLGHPPISSKGHISFMDDEIDHYNYYMSTAPTIFGNSGGACYRWSDERKQYEYVGIPSRISVQPMGFSADAITHMGYFIPIDRIYNLIDDNDYQFIYDKKYNITKCRAERNKKVSDAHKRNRNADD